MKTQLEMEEMYREFVASLQGYVDLESELDMRDDTARAYVKLRWEEIILYSELWDLVAIFSRGMASTRPKNMDGFAELKCESAVVYVRIGHAAEAFLQKLLADNLFVEEFLQIHALLVMASKDKDVRGLILDGKILNQNSNKPKTNGRRS